MKQNAVPVRHLLLPAAMGRGRKLKKKPTKCAVIKLLFIYTSIIFLRMRGKSFRDGLTFLPHVVKGGLDFVYQG